MKKLHPKCLAIFLIRVYQVCLSPYFGNSCKYYPSCSAYAIEALHKKGFLIGSLMAFYRILRCNPFSRGGYDPVDINAKINLKDIYNED